jgi:hypothetical protein
MKRIRALREAEAKAEEHSRATELSMSFSMELADSSQRNQPPPKRRAEPSDYLQLTLTDLTFSTNLDGEFYNWAVSIDNLRYN